jgi:hypothetical protein
VHSQSAISSWIAAAVEYAHREACSKLRELDIVLLLDELGTELLFLPRDGC